MINLDDSMRINKVNKGTHLIRINDDTKRLLDEYKSTLNYPSSYNHSVHSLVVNARKYVLISRIVHLAPIEVKLNDK